MYEYKQTSRGNSEIRYSLGEFTVIYPSLNTMAYPRGMPHNSDTWSERISIGGFIIFLGI